MNEALIKHLQTTYPTVRIVMASKYIGPENFKSFLDAGIKDFGESRVEAFIEKAGSLSHLDITWHFLGPLQTKKVKKIINDIDYLHSLDRVKLAVEIDKRRNEPLRCFVEVNISGEPQKHGFSPAELPDFLNRIKDLENINVIGLMGMASLTRDKKTIAAQFGLLKTLRDNIARTHPGIKELSMGMSNDYEIALENGATVLRLGRILLGEAYEDEQKD